LGRDGAAIAFFESQATTIAISYLNRVTVMEPARHRRHGGRNNAVTNECEFAIAIRLPELSSSWTQQILPRNRPSAISDAIG
jgi:hypothetical protein